ncbi:Serine/threonine-protein kinase ATR, partial [Clarias magur]
TTGEADAQTPECGLNLNSSRGRASQTTNVPQKRHISKPRYDAPPSKRKRVRLEDG